MTRLRDLSCLDAYGVRPAGGLLEGSVDCVVVAPAGASLDDAFERARVALSRGQSVRVVGCGVSYPNTWPAWVREHSELTLVELGAYEGRTRMEASRPLADELGAWCDAVFGGVIKRLSGREVFRSGAAARLLQGTMDAAAVVEGLRGAHPDSLFEVVDPHWAGSRLLSGGATSLRPDPRWALPAVVTVGLIGSAARAVRDHFRGEASRTRLASQPRVGAPRLWLALIPDWERANKHILSTLAREAIDRGEPLGVILMGSWGVGVRDDATHSVLGEEVWSGLGWLREHLESVTVVQAVTPAGSGALIGAVARGVGASALVTARVMRDGPPPFMDRSAGVLELGKLLSRDVLQAVLAAAATREALPLIPPDSCVVFCAANMPPLAAVERTLSDAGRPTAEYMHGVGNDAWHGTAESSVSLRFVWTESDGRALLPTGQRTETAGLPVPRLDRAAGHQNVLLLTNYFHRDLALGGRVAQRGAYQRELLAIPALLRAEVPDWPLRFRWRAHPAEVPALVAAAHAELDAVALSNSDDLTEDLAWADVVISAHSSTVAESIFAGRAVFVHLRPELVDSPFTSYVHPVRRFCKAEEAAAQVAACLRLLRLGDPAALAPEVESRQMVGESGVPRSLFAAVSEWSEARREVTAQERERGAEREKVPGDNPGSSR